MNDKLASLLANIFLLLTILLICYFVPFNYHFKIGIFIALIPTIAICLYFWQPFEMGKERLSFWIKFLLFGIIWSFVGLVVASLIYRVSLLKLLQFDSSAWGKIRYLGILGMGPFFAVISAVSILRIALLRRMKRK